MLKYLHSVSDSAVFLYPLPAPKELEFVSWGEFTMDGRGLITSKVAKNGQTAGKEWIASRSFCGSIFKIFWMRHNESDRS